MRTGENGFRKDEKLFLRKRKFFLKVERVLHHSFLEWFPLFEKTFFFLKKFSLELERVLHLFFYDYFSLGSLGHDEHVEVIPANRIKRFGNNVKFGITCTEVNGQLVCFKAHDRSHPKSAEIYAELDRLSNELKEYGHEYESSWITRPLKYDETIESVLCGHSEKLAIAFNFIQNPRPTFIQITKNLRVCGECHRATKLIAKIRQCEIIVRDANRIQHFYKNGLCSCQDHF
ncbi:unnamed protein product [Rotaria magnacalcarata]|uniref:DYW domain-containing protein n=2 Tax=Rotaria magnacalcarata TaxID=392030 RepID=A0A816US28_9BILA|nr:unnamed protein product [Rotaria magnacalcarata]